jgi:Dual OB-containing domain
MRLIITDVTEMHGGNYCVAGWDAQALRMVRPLPNGANWTAGLLQQHDVAPGALIDMTPTGQQHQSAFPHRTEDMLVNAAGIGLVRAGPIAWLAAEAPPTHATVDRAFGGHLAHSRVWNGVQQGVHVPENTQIGSLSAVRLPVDSLTLFENNYQGKRSLRGYLDDGNACYDLPVVGKTLREAYRLNGVDAAKQLLPAQGDIHVRLGLARAWPGQPGKCSLMINGIYG